MAGVAGIKITAASALVGGPVHCKLGRVPHPSWNQIAGGLLTDDQLSQLDEYLDLLIEKNRVLNLTRITDRTEAEIKHVADALTVLAHLPASRTDGGLKLADVGTGGGIPGVMIAIARPDIDVTLIDATRKKLDAVKLMCNAIGLDNIRTLHARMETVEEKFHVVTTRAVAEMETLLVWCSRLIKRNGVLLALKGPKLDEELQRLSSKNRRQWKLDIHAVDLPQLVGHQIVVGRQTNS